MILCILCKFALLFEKGIKCIFSLCDIYSSHVILCYYGRGYFLSHAAMQDTSWYMEDQPRDMSP